MRKIVLYNDPMTEFGLSFSLHRCSELSLDKQAVLTAAINDLAITRYRLMSYWDIHESQQGQYNFAELDWQMDMVAAAGGSVTLCLGVRQPRWPEFHMPSWAEHLPADQWHAALLAFVQQVVERYKNHPALVSWQLENEALLKTFGDNTEGDFDRERLKKEYKLVKTLDPNHPVIMTLSDSYGIPFRAPKPDMFAMSMYRVIMDAQGVTHYSKRPAWFYRLRKNLILLLRFRHTFIHELQAEMWANRAITEVPIDEQLAQMNPTQLAKNVHFAQACGMPTIDVWGLEWWYWLKVTHNRPENWDEMRVLFSSR